ncbi:unnamed protein product [Rotaria socialis]|uniref:G domain-containing protein n=1 Tax=Rotaria socialis TaxID=392032 RepID=A0A820JMS5_9BILA|nr:unnamed protein product [Rotaria socialis]CAF3719592.1 unnamed protein product [Rotaria socialis]CAF4328705.1 unnamed protein product [Rotaria socialis]CAF4391969.1 unnamed protein product [Rotaria socialis]CAF4584152.1 unnamed protein product [Rotaria socialis]
MAHSKWILIVGSTGEGKSSLINLLMGREVANVNDSADGVTMDCQEYVTKHAETEYHLYDTIGLHEADGGKVPHKNAIEKLVAFAKSHSEGFNLIIFVMAKGRIRHDFEQNHLLFHDTIFCSQAPSILYVNGCEFEKQTGKWVTENAERLKSFQFKDVVCGTTMKHAGEFEERIAPKREETRTAIWNAIDQFSAAKRAPITRYLKWWQKAINIVLNVFGQPPLFQTEEMNKFAEILRKKGVREDVIKELVKTLQ